MKRIWVGPAPFSNTRTGRQDKDPLATGAFVSFHIGLGDNTGKRYEILASGDRF